jgi:hypothetical protein
LAVSLSLAVVMLNLEFYLIYLEVSIVEGFSKFGGSSDKIGGFTNLFGALYSWSWFL